MPRVEKISRLVITLNEAIPVGTDHLIILRALNKMQGHILELISDDLPTFEEVIATCPLCGDLLNNCDCQVG